MQKHRTERGTTILELCISLSLAGIVISAAVISLQRAVTWYLELRVRISAERTVLESYTLIEQALTRIDSSRATDTWKIQLNGSFTFANGTPHPISKIKGTSQPRPNSDGLSILNLAPNRVLAIVSESPQKISACPVFPNQSKIAGILSFIKRGVHGSHQYSLFSNLNGATWPNECGSLSGGSIESVTVKNSLEGIAGQFVVPVLQESSLFVDRSSHLRLISHRGAWIRENQPLVDGVRTLKISSSTTESGVTLFHVRITTVHGREKRWSRPISIARREGLHEKLF